MSALSRRGLFLNLQTHGKLEHPIYRGSQARAARIKGPDGQRFVMIQAGGPDSEASQINVVLNWFEELKRRVPTGVELMSLKSGSQTEHELRLE